MPVTTDKLHDHAIKAEEHAEQLATGLAEIGADEQAVKAVTSIAGVFRKIAAGLAKGGTAEPEEAPAEEAPAAKPTMDQALDEHMAARRA